jgi:hypothetical protein
MLGSMTRATLETAMREGVPFVIKMADGNQYTVTDRTRIALGSSYAMVVDENDLPHVLPLLTMTGLSYLESKER